MMGICKHKNQTIKLQYNFVDGGKVTRINKFKLNQKLINWIMYNFN